MSRSRLFVSTHNQPYFIVLSLLTYLSPLTLFCRHLSLHRVTAPMADIMVVEVKAVTKGNLKPHARKT